MASIQESLELLEGIKVIGVDVKKVMADGKVDIADLQVAMQLMGQLGVLVAAVKGADQIPGEIKELDGAELQQLGLKVIEVVEAIKAAQ